MVMKYRLWQVRILGRYHIVLLIEPRNQKACNTQESDPRANIGKCESWTIIEEHRLNHPIQIHIVHDQNPASSQEHELFTALVATRQKQKERHEKTTNEKTDRPVFPMFVKTKHKIAGFFR